MQALIEKLWYQTRFFMWPLLPLSALFKLLAQRRKGQLQTTAKALPVPVIVVGNITVGGTGKTPLVIAVVKTLQQHGYRPGVISRGFGGEADYPYQLDQHSTAAESGDEPLLIAQSCACPVVVDPERCAAATHLLTHNPDVNVIISDDGLQHYALARDIEICVIDGQRQLGNGFCLPAGPLREPISRLNTVDFIVQNGQQKNTDKTHSSSPSAVIMELKTGNIKALPFTRSAIPSVDQAIHAVAAIGNPQRFFTSLAERGFTHRQEHCFADHFQYQAQHLKFDDAKAVIMTEKDAVKCAHFKALTQHFYLPVEAQLPASFWQALLHQLEALDAHSRTGQKL